MLKKKGKKMNRQMIEKSKTSYLVFLSLIMLMVLLSSNLTAGDLKVIKEKTFATSEGKWLKVDASLGDIKINSWGKSEVFVKIYGNKKAADNVKFYFEENSEGVNITAKAGRGFWNWFSRNMNLKIEIFVPENYNLKLSTSGGDMSLNRINGDIKLTTSGGDIRIKESAGDIVATTSGGDIVFFESKGNAKLTTSGGDIRATGFDGNMAAATSGGDIDLIGSHGKINAVTSGGDIKLDYLGENFGISLVTSGGDINVRLPANFSAKAELKTSGGEISCNLPTNNVVKISTSRYETDLNNGGLPFICKTSGGDITVTKK